jgi:hypothetical protein
MMESITGDREYGDSTTMTGLLLYTTGAKLCGPSEGPLETGLELSCCGKNVRPARTRLKPGGWRKGRFITPVGHHPGSLQKWHQPCSSRLRGFYASECRSKQAGRTTINVAVSLSLGGYSISY